MEKILCLWGLWEGISCSNIINKKTINIAMIPQIHFNCVRLSLAQDWDFVFSNWFMLEKVLYKNLATCVLYLSIIFILISLPP